MGNTIWRTEPISVEKLLDDLRVGGERLIKLGDSSYSPKCI